MLLHRKEKLRAAKKKMLNKSPTQSKKVEKEVPPFRNHLLKDESRGKGEFHRLKEDESVDAPLCVSSVCTEINM
jgi:hypothetical protein